MIIRTKQRRLSLYFSQDRRLFIVMNGGAVKPLKNASSKRRFLLKKQRVMDFYHRGFWNLFTNKRDKGT